LGADVELLLVVFVAGVVAMVAAPQHARCVTRVFGSPLPHRRGREYDEKKREKRRL